MCKEAAMGEIETIPHKGVSSIPAICEENDEKSFSE
jgi:hypothetical protein